MNTRRAARDFPIVGIGCSAGGLDALERFFSHVPRDCGIGFVVVQHLAPDHVSALPELLRRVTGMAVQEVVDALLVRPDSIAVIAPNHDLSLLHGRLHLLEASQVRGQRSPIDFFFRSLALDRKDRAIGVLLSGMGSDGVLGLKAIKEAEGLTLVQDPASAQADGMPGSALRAGLADIVALPEELPGRIAAFLHPPGLAPGRGAPIPGTLPGALERITLLLRERSGNDFSAYKPNTLLRRIERRTRVRQLAGIDDYLRCLRAEPQELDLLFKELLIGVTGFFRDPPVWSCLAEQILPELIRRFPAGKALRAWVAGCSTGEEAYSLAIVFEEALLRAAPAAGFTLQIYATDLDPEAIARARKGVYPLAIGADIAPERLARCFEREGAGYRVTKRIRDRVVFATQNVISDPPFTKLDLLLCRNLMIYFGARLQARLLPLLHYALAPGGLLVLGSAETVGNFAHLFGAVSLKNRIYRSIDRVSSLADLEFPGGRLGGLKSGADSSAPERADSLARLTDQLIQQSWSPAAVLVNAEGDILYVSGRTGKYLEPAAGRSNMNVHAMAREGLREALTGMIRKALSDGAPIVLRGLRVGTNGGVQVVDVTLQPVDKPEPLRGRVLIVFKDVAAAPARRRAAKAADPQDDALAQELRQTRDALRVTQDEMQATVEELKTSNEELQSANEELQSTNEELTTAKEELQSLNEELQTVNAELQSKVDDLTGVQNDMSNLLNSTDIATVFLDAEMRLRRYTTHATRLFRFIDSDLGRPLEHVVNDLEYPALVPDSQEVLRTLKFRETAVRTHDGRWYRVRIMPYRTQDNVIDGVVTTFTDITDIKRLEAQLRGRER